MKPRLTLAFGFLGAVTATGLAALSPAVVSLVDLRVYDAMLRAAETRPASNRVAIAAIDDRSVSAIGRWPWPREVMAQLVDRIRGLGASVVAIDMLLADPDRIDQTETSGASQSDSALAAVAAEGRVVMSYALTFASLAPADPDCVLHPIIPILVDGADGRSPLDHLFHPTGVVCTLPALTRSAGSSGYLNAAPDSDGLLRRIPLLMEFRGGVYPSLALAAVLKATGVKRLTLTALPGERTLLTMEKTGTPLDARGTMLIRFRGARGTYTHIPAIDILNGRVPADALRDRIVFVGSTALGAQDAVSTPLDIAMPGIEVHATAADTLLQGDFLSTPPYSRAYELTATMASSLIVAATLAFLGFFAGSLAAAALVGLLWWATFIGVTSEGTFLSPIFPTLGMLLVLPVVTIAKVRHERRLAQEERVRRERAHQFAVQSLMSLTEVRDSATGQHARRTQAYSRLLACRLATFPRFRAELTPERVELISQLCPLHDIGKVGVRDAVLNKPGALSDEERDEIRRHPVFGHETIARAERLAGLDGDDILLQLAKEIVYTHHERWDGRGYPRGLQGEAIPVAGRIVALVDVYDALSNPRCYRAEGFSHEQTVATIEAGRGTHFDPDVVDAFLSLSQDFRRLSAALREEATLHAALV